MAKKKKPVKAPAKKAVEPEFTKEQLVKCKTLGVPRDVIAAVLQDGQKYTKTQAKALAKKFLEKVV